MSDKIINATLEAAESAKKYSKAAEAAESAKKYSKAAEAVEVAKMPSVVAEVEESIASTEMVVDDGGFVGHLVSTSKQYCSLVPRTEDERKFLFNAMVAPDGHLSDLINVPICVVDIYCEEIDMVNESTGEFVTVPRIVLLTKDHKSYQCVSKGVHSAVRKLIQVFGRPSWPDGINIVATQISKGKYNILSVKLA